MDLLKKIVSTMGPIFNVVNPQNKIGDSNNRPVANALMIFVIGIACGFALCILLVGQNIITISTIS